MRDHASGTAILVALGILALGQRRPEQGGALVSEWERSLLRETLREIGGVAAALSSPVGLAIAAPAERLCVPGIITHFGLRKRLIERGVASAVNGGYGRVVVIGAGLDMLTLRMERSGLGARCVELDHPATQAYKRKLLARAGAVARRIELVPADLARITVSEALARSMGADLALPTVFVVEGVTMYLDEGQVRGLLADLRSVAPRARLLFTFMEPDASGHVRFTRQTPMLRLLLRLCGEPFKWGVRAAELGAFLEAAGWTLERVAGPAEFAACARGSGLRMSEDAFVGEFLAEASIGSPP